MKRLLTTLLFVTMVAISYHANAVSAVPVPEIQIDGNGYVGCDVNLNCWTGASQSNAAFNINELELVTGNDAGTLELYYRYNVGGVKEGSFANNYTTVTGNGIWGDYTANANGSISWDGGNSIACPACFLVIKDGIHDPFWYAFSLGDWNGTGNIDFRNFWLGTGEISHVSIYGGDGSDKNIVPIPASAWLMMSGLIGLVGVARRKR